METTTNSLQELIEQRAKRRLTADLKALADTIIGNRLISDSSYEMPPVFYNDKDSNIKGLFWVNGKVISGHYLLDLQKFWLSTYIKEETEMFVQKVDSLQEQIEELKSGNYEEDF